MIYYVTMLNREGISVRAFNRHSMLVQSDFYRLIERELYMGIHGRSCSAFTLRLQAI